MSRTFEPRPPTWPKLTGGKRAPSCPLVISSSSESDEDDNENNVSMEKIPSPRINLDLNTLKSGLPTDTKGNKHQNFSNRSPRSEALTVQTNLNSPTDSNISPASRSDSLSPATSSSYATEHDHDYENIASPCSSTASGPTYVRPPGFEHHAQEILSSSVKIKKKKTSALFAHRESLRKREPTPPKVKPKREPLPMKLRALPQSFWQQPNQPHQVSPGNIFRVLPPLSIKDTGEDVTEVRPVTPTDDSNVEKDVNKKPTRLREQQVSVADTELLFRLFEGINEEKKPKSTKRQRMRNPKPVLRGKSHMKGLLSGNDPYIVDAVTNKLFPQLSLENTKSGIGGVTSLQLITVPNGDRTLTLPTLSVEQNYPQILSELVTLI